MTTRICVVGAGLIGGSLLRALAGRPEWTLTAADADERTRHRVHEVLGIPCEVAPPANAEVIVLATPAPTIPGLLAKFGAAGRLVTDTAGAKAQICAEAARSGPAIRFVGAHPMSGSEQQGFDASSATLFSGRVVAICTDGASDDDLVTVERLWHAVGATSLRCTSAEHDDAVATISHLPALVAAALAGTVGRGSALEKRLAAGGYRDTTRVAEDPTVRFSATMNRGVPQQLRRVSATLARWADNLERGALPASELDAAAAARRALLGG